MCFELKRRLDVRLFCLRRAFPPFAKHRITLNSLTSWLRSTVLKEYILSVSTNRRPPCNPLNSSLDKKLFVEAFN